MTSHACCFTGHRTLTLEEQQAVRQRLPPLICRLASQGANRFLCGGALGFDTLAALSVLECKSRQPHLQLHLVLPCGDQTRGWAQEDRRLYQWILSQADDAMVLFPAYRRGCMQIRNRFLVEQSECCVCFLREQKGGTYYTVRYAQKIGRMVYNLAKDECLLKEHF